MSISIVIPSRWNITKLEWLLQSLNIQTVLPDKVYIIVDKFFTKDEYNVFSYLLLKQLEDDFKNVISIITNINSDFVPNKWVSYVRNYGIDISNTDFIYVIDDDNQFDQDFIKNSLEDRIKINENTWKDFLLSPTIMYRETWRIQSQWMSDFNFLLSKVVLNNLGTNPYGKVKMIGWNSLLWPSGIFREIRFDERFEFVYEDLDFSYRTYLAWFPVIVSRELKINHMEREKNKLEHIFIWTPKDAYQKSRNRILFVKKVADKLQKIQFFWFGLWIQTLWFIFNIIFYWKDRLSLLKSIYRWVVDWIKYKI